MDQIDVDATRPDPYRNYRIRIRWDGRHVAGISRMSALKRTTEVVEYREGGDHGPSRRLPGRTGSDPIMLERGVTHDLEFERWANAVQTAGADPGATDTAFRKDIAIDLYNEAGQRVIAYRVYRCWVSAFQVLPDLDANAQAVVIESITLQNEGWARLPPDPDPLEDFAQRLEQDVRLADLQPPDRERRLLEDVIGAAREGAAGEPRSGLAVLFAGDDAAGMARCAGALATELGRDHYRVDLGAVMSPAIGETEANLGRLLDAAERSGAVLLFDEADALFGQRTGEADGGDRHAVSDAEDLFRHILSYPGLAILTTHSARGLDSGIRRRLRATIGFPFDTP